MVNRPPAVLVSVVIRQLILPEGQVKVKLGEAIASALEHELAGGFPRASQDPAIAHEIARGIAGHLGIAPVSKDASHAFAEPGIGRSHAVSPPARTKFQRRI